MSNAKNGGKVFSSQPLGVSSYERVKKINKRVMEALSVKKLPYPKWGEHYGLRQAIQ